MPFVRYESRKFNVTSKTERADKYPAAQSLRNRRLSSAIRPGSPENRQIARIAHNLQELATQRRLPCVARNSAIAFVPARSAVGLFANERIFMQRKPSERGSVLLLELLVVISILGVLLAMSGPSFMRLRMSQQANQALVTIRAIQNAEAYYLQIHHNGYAPLGVLAGTGIAVPATCDAPLLLGGAQAQTQSGGYFFQFTPGPTPAVLGAGCTAPGSTTFTLTANPVSGQGRSFFVTEFGVIHYSDSGPADSTSPPWFW
jgi:type II secretory pathway pseudopilin PulG